MRKEGAWVEGAFSCVLCRKSFDMESQMRSYGVKFIDKHIAGHITDFFYYAFTQDQVKKSYDKFVSERPKATLLDYFTLVLQNDKIRKAFFNYQNNKLTIALLGQGMGSW